MYYNNKYLVETFEEKPVFNANPKILFIARLWNPEGEELSGLPQSKIDERKEINEIRIKCIQKNRTAKLKKFVGYLPTTLKRIHILTWFGQKNITTLYESTS